MHHPRYSGRIVCGHDRLGETGREWITRTMHERQRTVRALCELEDETLLRDVTYTVDREFRLLDVYVRLTRGDRFVGCAWFCVFEGGAECQGFPATEGRFSARRTGIHPLMGPMAARPPLE